MGIAVSPYRRIFVPPI